jgi:cationic peptide transport system permease protein
MIIFLRRLLLLLVTLFFLTFVGFSLSYYPRPASWLVAVGRVLISGLMLPGFWRIQYQRSAYFRAAESGVPGHDGTVHSGFRLCADGGHSVGMLAGIIATNGRINSSAPSLCSASQSRSSGWLLLTLFFSLTIWAGCRFLAV